MGLLSLRSRSKSTSYQPDTSNSSYASSSRPNSRASSRGPYSYLSTTSDGIPIVRESSSSASSRRSHHSRAGSSSSISSGSSNGSSYLYPTATTQHGVYYVSANPMSAVTVPHGPSHYFGPQRQVVYPAGYDPSSSPSHLQSLHLDSHRGRPRSNTAREKILLSSAGVPLAGYPPVDAPTGAPSSHESYHSSSQSSTKSGGFLSFIRSRSKSKSRERDALYPASEKRHRERDAQIMQRDEEAELARRMEKDLRLRDLDDPYRTVRRERSRSFDGHPVDPNQLQQQRALERQQRRNRDLDPDVQDNTRYNATSLRYVDGPPRPSRGRSDYHVHASGYATDAQPQMLRRSATTAAHVHHPSSTHSSGHPTRYSHQLQSSRGIDVESDAPPLKGWFNQRGDELIDKNTVICQPLDRQYSSRFKHYPPVGQGFGDSHGNIIDINGRLLKRVG
ncbi:hypothetical protein PIIN_02833 [Serendipita indica DSM 11827]|uniref:Uncharacterized protein n=1 Tax=Serendipita indica (strain DSM 11827) TaxID=1109443 RepID=G4TCD0_SERID|nr:hypothetical protein PIIN_02833 [Serendipita indica DSM 11827]